MWANELPPERTLTPAETVQLFTTCFVGSEKIDAEFETDYFTSLVSQAGAVGGSLLKGKHSGLPKPARRLATFVRGVLIALYLLVRGVTSGSRFGMFAVALALAVGGAFLALTLIASPPALVTSTGMVLVLAGFALAFLRGADYMFAIATAAVIAVIAGVAVLVEQNRLVRRSAELARGVAPGRPDRGPRCARDAARRRAQTPRESHVDGGL